MLDLNPKFHNTLNQNPNHANYRHRFNGGTSVQFRLETMEEDSGVCSPPLWRSMSPPDSPVRFPKSRALSPASRAQAIAKGQRELMEMVESMPETSYELSLKDIVEQRREFTDVSVEETQSVEDGERRLILDGGQQSQRRRKSKKGSVRRQESSKTGRIIVKNGSMNHSKGLLINMFFPFSIGSKKTTKMNSFNHGSGVKSSPKMELLKKSGGGGDRRDWWKKFTESGISDSSGITSSSGGESTGRSGSSGSSGSSTAGSLRNNSDRRQNGCSQGCWSLFPFRKKKS
ncbi:hypothetical protein L1987_64345 [Smallanthus sonchifolius]|uniref:Uncharacterized protein n=1 Tax=Smallanthus sonchifolius TaxID=185202 RepID=A0ACB9CFQ9_9ASTR|nr:hypothetical protein L1987_64345 [Smallanthus sonchifolius]